MTSVKLINFKKEDKQMISKFKYSLVAVILLVLLGFGFQNKAQGQEGPLWCPGVEVDSGWLQQVVTPLDPAPNFSGSLIGTVEAHNGENIGGMDWQHGFSPNALDQIVIDQQGDLISNIFRSFDFFEFTHPSNVTGAQLVSWWTQKDGRNTFLQLTNAEDFDFIDVHVVILDENCNEIRDFCDEYSSGDTHVYNFGDLVTNVGDTPDDSVLQGHEGFVTFTVVNNCEDKQAIDYNFLAGTAYINDAQRSVRLWI